MAQSTLDLILRTKKTGSGEKEATSGLNSLSNAFKSVTGISLGTAAAFGAVVGALKFSISAAMEAQQVTAQTEAVIKATGGAAGLSATQIGDLALAESRLTGIEDEVVQTGENMLLTFKNIAGDTFPRATRAMEDMAVAMNGGNLEGIDLKGTAIQLGKALNDPIKGVTALTRVGVTFTDAQKDAIEAMVEANDIAGAQALILDELESEFGGAAKAAGETFAGEMAKAQNEIGNFGEAVGNIAIPAMADGLEETTDWMVGVQLLKQNLDKGNISVGDFAKGVLSMNFSVSAATVVQEQQKIALENSTEATDVLNDSVDDVKQQFINASDATEDNTGMLEENTDAAEAAKEEQDRLKEALSDLHTIMDGPVSDAYESFKDKQDELKGKVNDLRGEINDLESQEYLTEEQQTRLGELQGELGETEGALVDLKEEHEETMARIIFGMAEEALARDGWTADEIEALTELGNKWGLYDDDTAEAMRAVEAAVSGFNESGNMDTLISDLDDAKSAAEDLSGTYNIDVVTTYSEIGKPPVGQYPGGNKGKQHGGPVWAGEWTVGEAGPETLVLAPGSTGYVIPNGGTNNNWNFNIYSSNPYPRLTDDYMMVRALAGA